MAFGWDDAIGLAGSIGSGLLNLNAQSQSARNSDQALQIALMNYNLQKRLADQQYELATAGRTDARGNRTSYIPGAGWSTEVTPTTRGLITASDANQRNALVNQLTRGESERTRAHGRRLDEGATADPLLQQLMRGFGAPTKGTVTGRNLVSNVTQAGEGADALKRAYGSAALRTGSGTVPLSQNMAEINRGGASGIRSAVARSRNEGDPLFQTQMNQWRTNLSAPYKSMVPTVGDMPFSPETQSAGLDASGANAAAVAAMRGTAGAGAGLAGGAGGLISVLGSQRQPNYDLFTAGVTEQLKNLLRKSGRSGGMILDPTVPDYYSAGGNAF